MRMLSFLRVILYRFFLYTVSVYILYMNRYVYINYVKWVYLCMYVWVDQETGNFSLLFKRKSWEFML